MRPTPSNVHRLSELPRVLRLGAALLSLAMLAAGCGFKGALTLPERETAAVAAPSVPAR
ncbi:MAG: hypothetical protein H7831_02025 [Magnetococcus sp. WYHC-3]